MKNLLTVATALITGLFFNSSAIAEDAKPAEWLFVHTAQTAEMTSDTTLVLPVTRDIFAFTDRPNRMHGYMKGHEFVSLWDEGEGDTFKADPPNAVLTWVDGDEMKEAEFLIISAETVSHGREIAYEVKLEAGETPEGNIGTPSLFVDSRFLPDGDQTAFMHSPRPAHVFPDGTWCEVDDYGDGSASRSCHKNKD